MSAVQPINGWRRARIRAFGLIELLITIAILAILAAVALPSFRYSLQSNRGVTETDDLINAINTARAEALARTRFVSICAANVAGTACSPSTTAWKNGWIVFTDDYVNKGTMDGDDAILRYWPAINSQDTVASNVKYIAFDRLGRATNDVSVDPATFTLMPAGCTGTKPLKRSINVGALGRASQIVGNCS